MKLRIEEVSISDERYDDVLHLRYQVLAEEPGTYFSTIKDCFPEKAGRRLFKPDLHDQQATLLAAYYGDKMVGTLRCYFGKKDSLIDSEVQELFPEVFANIVAEDESICEIGRTCVLKEYRTNSFVIANLMSAFYHLVLTRGYSHIFCLSTEATRHYYSQIGLKTVSEGRTYKMGENITAFALQQKVGKKWSQHWWLAVYSFIRCKIAALSPVTSKIINRYFRKHARLSKKQKSYQAKGFIFLTIMSLFLVIGLIAQ